MLAMPVLVSADNYTFTGSTISLTGILDNAVFTNVIINGETTESGFGIKSPDNPYSITGISNPVINVNGMDYNITTDSSLYDGDTFDVVSGLETHYMDGIFDGTEDWIKSPADQQTVNTTLFYASLAWSNIASNTVYATSHFTARNIIGTINDFEGVQIIAEYCNVYIRMTGVLTLDEFKAYLVAQFTAGTPVTVLYKLINPVTYTYTPQNIPTYVPNTTISINKGILNIIYSQFAVITIDDDTTFVLKFCLYCFACIMVTFMALRFILGFCRTGLEVLNWLPFKNTKLFEYKERRRGKK